MKGRFVGFFKKFLGKMMLASLLLFCAYGRTSAQHILFVNDNNYILYNTDTVRTDMGYTMYAGYDYWSIPDSGGTYPSDSVMASYDLVIWYCSTNGVGLYFWDDSASGCSRLTTYASTGKPVWVIGIDILYQLYDDSAHFVPGNFAYDYMGLSSYDGQSYIDDGGVGLPQADRVSTASTLFPDSVQWEFTTLYDVPEVTPRAEVLPIYEMGPSSYALAGAKCMVHNHQGGVNVMSTFFDPALMDSFNHRVTFLQNGITYLLGSTAVDGRTKPQATVALYPNPADKKCQVAINTATAMDMGLEIADMTGKTMLQQTHSLGSGKNVVDIATAGWPAGTYLVFVKDHWGSVISTNRLTKE